MSNNAIEAIQLSKHFRVPQKEPGIKGAVKGLFYRHYRDVHAVKGITPWKRERRFQKQFTMIMGQRTQLWWDLPAWDSFLLNKEIFEIPDAQFEKTVKELSRLLEIEELLDIPTKKLSLGQRMKAEFACIRQKCCCSMSPPSAST
jgi:ABC-type uncharacterized transport system ATPase subunit